MPFFGPTRAALAAAAARGADIIPSLRLVLTAEALTAPPPAHALELNAELDALCAAARELAAVQHTLAVAALDLSEKLQERTEGLVKSLLAKKEGVPEELRAAAGEWSRAASAGRRELKTAVDRTHKLLNAYLDKTEKASAPAPKAKPAAKPAAKKKAAAKKPAAKKKAAPKAGA